MAQRHPGGRHRGPRGPSLARADAGIRKRSPAPPRTDRDGDLDMDAAGGRGRGRGSGPSRAPRGPRANPFSRGAARGAVNRNNFNTDQMEKAVLRGMNTGDVIQSSKINGLRVIDGALKEVRGQERRPRDVEVTVTGWEHSKAANNPGGGVNELVAFLQRKASSHSSSQIHVHKVSF